MGMHLICTKCNSVVTYIKDDLPNFPCKKCGGEYIKMKMDYQDYITLCYIWSGINEPDYHVHWDLYNAMVDLKEKDIIEYNLKMSQFRTQVEQQKSSRIRNSNMPKCPKCGSTNISAGQRGYSLLTGFLGSGKTVNRCVNCGYKWSPKK